MGEAVAWCCGRAARVSLIVLGAAVLAGCGPSARQFRHPQSGVTHIVQPGETLYRIGLQYGVSPEYLMAANQLRDPRDLRAGQALLIPGPHLRARAPQTRPHEIATEEPQDEPLSEERGRAPTFDWPISHGTLSSGFGVRNGVMHDGVDIAAEVGTPVHAAGDGQVIFAGSLRGYGNVVILQHDNHFVTIYGHNLSNAVSEGDEVKRGQAIAEVGLTGRASGPNLHFELRHDNIATDPMRYLPPPERSATSSVGF